MKAKSPKCTTGITESELAELVKKTSRLAYECSKIEDERLKKGNNRSKEDIK